MKEFDIKIDVELRKELLVQMVEMSYKYVYVIIPILQADNISVEQLNSLIILMNNLLVNIKEQIAFKNYIRLLSLYMPKIEVEK